VTPTIEEIVMRKLQSVALTAALAAAAAGGLAVSTATANAKTVTGQHATHQTAVTSAAGKTYTVAANEREVLTFLHDVIDEHHGNHVARYLNADAAWHGGTVGTVNGRADVAGLFAGVVASLPNSHIDVQDIFGQGDQVAVRVTVSGTQKGALLGIPATGRNIQWTGEDLYSLHDGKISSIWAGDDWTAILYDTGTYKAPWIA
jgi:predicted SnoaL-like aldol condensation-catalyzing enzyme